MCRQPLDERSEVRTSVRFILPSSARFPHNTLIYAKILRRGNVIRQRPSDIRHPTRIGHAEQAPEKRQRESLLVAHRMGNFRAPTRDIRAL
jgi:hypothetical protein